MNLIKLFTKNGKMLGFSETDARPPIEQMLESYIPNKPTKCDLTNEDIDYSNNQIDIFPVAYNPSNTLITNVMILSSNSKKLWNESLIIEKNIEIKKDFGKVVSFDVLIPYNDTSYEGYLKRLVDKCSNIAFNCNDVFTMFSKALDERLLGLISITFLGMKLHQNDVIAFGDRNRERSKIIIR